MSKLNAKTKKTEKVVHLLVTSLCARNCKYCCNKQYDLNDVPYVTEEELRRAEVICITGGEPFLFTDPSAIAVQLKLKYKNIKKVFVYTNAVELGLYLSRGQALSGIDGLNVLIKLTTDKLAFETIIKDNPDVLALKDNWLYIFDSLVPTSVGNFKAIERVWQKDFEAADDSIFRKI